MINVRINPAGIEEVEFAASSDLFEDLDLAVWPIVRAELRRLDRKLKKATQRVLDEAERRPGRSA